MQLNEITTTITSINSDSKLPMKAEGSVDIEYINKTYPGFITGLTNFLVDANGKRRNDNAQALRDTKVHTFVTDRSAKPDVACGRIRTDKGIILIY